MNNAPFRVVCLEVGDGWYFIFNGRRYNNKGPKRGDIVTVIGVGKGLDNLLYYSLAEWPDDLNGEGWLASSFAPIDPYENISSEIAQWKIVEEREDVVTTKEKIQL